MKKSVLVLSLFIIALLTGCSGSPKATTEGFFKELTAGNFDKTAKYTEIPLPVFDMDVPPMEFYFKTMRAENIKEIDNDGTQATVAVDLSAVDLLPIIIGLMQTPPPEDANVEELEELFNRLFIEGITNPDAERKTLTVELNLRKLDKDGKKRWVIMADEALSAALNLQDPAEAGEAYEDAFDYSDEPPLERIGTETSKGKFMGSDEVADLCSFFVNGELYYMYCEESQRTELEEKYKEKELTITYDVFGLAEYEARAYVLVGYK